MADSLSPEQRASITAMARNHGNAIAVLELLKEVGCGPEATLAALTTALTAHIATIFKPEHRLLILNKLLAETIQEWAAEAAAAQGAGATRQ